KLTAYLLEQSAVRRTPYKIVKSESMSKNVSRRNFSKSLGAVAGSALAPASVIGTLAEQARAQGKPNPSYYAFPQGFLWACATAAYQVEGAAKEDGRGPSIWDAFSHQSGHTYHNQTGDVADNNYHLYKGDIQLLKWLGAKSYRFSV